MVLRNAAGILDAVDDDGRRGATLLLTKGHPRTVAAALELDIVPSTDAELFRLEAAMSLLKQSAALPISPARPLHELVMRIADGHDEEIKRLLFAMLPSAQATRSLLHRLAIRDQEQAFRAVLAGLGRTVPRDVYGRPPSAVASPSRRPVFARIEQEHANAGPSE
jgi:hypothetical protein